VTAIGSGAFSNCTGLTSVTVSWPDPASIEYGSDVFYLYNMPKPTLHVPKGTGSLYRAIEPWSLFTTIVESVTASEPIPTNRLKAFIHESALTITGLKTGETISLFDMNGRRRLTLRAAGETQTVSIANLPRGIYILRTAGETVKVRKEL
jgi:hypothetical protein